MLPRRIRVLTCGAIFAANCLAQEIRLGYQGRYGACFFWGSIRNDQLVAEPPAREDSLFKATVDRILKDFSIGQKLWGFDQAGKSITPMVENLSHEADMTDRTLTLGYPDGHPEGGVLFTTRPIHLQILSSIPASVRKADESVLRARARQLWAKHVPERYEDEKPTGFRLGKLTATRVQGAPGVLLISWPFEFQLAGDTSWDDRGSMFFIYVPATRQIRFATLGHPEWSGRSTVLTVKPEMYFRLPSSRRIYFAGERFGGWEDWGYAIFDVQTGKEIFNCY